MLVQPTVGGSVPGPANNTNSNKDCRKDNLDLPQPLQTAAYLCLNWIVGKSGLQRGLCYIAAGPSQTPVKKTTDPCPIRMTERGDAMLQPVEEKEEEGIPLDEWFIHTNLQRRPPPPPPSRWSCPQWCMDLWVFPVVLLLMITGGVIWFRLRCPCKHNQTLRRGKRTTKDHLPHADYPHGFATNEWWQVMNTTAHLNNQTNCYVCNHMPVSTNSPGLWPYPADGDRTACLVGLATHHWSKARVLTHSRTG
ncbi:uncharacterized protein LOC115587645 [Sparus aurata]|uniref:uncharacterized protein LOC115587578 n=1 Tax=Sparus aurata TaxID=8175 RepID=UPI0011C1AD7D|nr:uncharacterized protein LOC115587578 [Sparus aurata]XP_030283342.1 uncharacterized protein LOC115587578 [Sparus aurata]XP_030283427.1 uncharacterized protein LOC115587645 [Sparus aurata]XP_030283428.1 uncharacterized protein LOC115587645 [Sparus aurata]